MKNPLIQMMRTQCVSHCHMNLIEMNSSDESVHIAAYIVKTKVNPDEFGSILAPAFKRIEGEFDGLTISIGNDEVSSTFLTCPYCGHKSEIVETFTEECLAFLKKYVMREYVLPQIHNLLRDFGKNLKRESRSFSKVGIEVKAEFNDTLPQRPISGPEPPDMTKVELLCCGEVIKVYDDWFELDRCPFCEKEIRLV